MAITKIQSESLNLADTYDFTGTVTGAGESNAPYFLARINTSQSVSSGTPTKLQYNNEILDSDNAYDNTTNYRWTPQVAGKYFIFHQWSVNTSTDCYSLSAIMKNGSNVFRFNGRNFDTDSLLCQGIIDLNGSSDYVEAKGYHEAGTSLTNPTNTNTCYFGGFLISTT
jgi:hypothetical protein